jgi:hypothetical protein
MVDGTIDGGSLRFIKLISKYILITQASDLFFGLLGDFHSERLDLREWSSAGQYSCERPESRDGAARLNFDGNSTFRAAYAASKNNVGSRLYISKFPPSGRHAL